MRGLRIAWVLFALVASPLRAMSGGGESSVVVVVHPQRTEAVNIEEVARIFLGRRRFWSDGARITPLNLPAGNVTRERFSRHVLHEESAGLAGYWNAQYFHGVLPPTVLDSPQAVKQYVATDRNAIGYLESGAVDATVRVLLTFE